MDDIVHDPIVESSVDRVPVPEETAPESSFGLGLRGSAAIEVMEPEDVLGVGAGSDILIADDHASNLVAYEAALAPLGRKLVLVQSGLSALAKLLEQDFALMLLDVSMPGMDGIETARLIRARPRNKGLPIIFITGTTCQDDVIVSAYELGAYDFVVKPILPRVLRAKAQLYLHLQERTQQLLRQATELRRARKLELELELEASERAAMVATAYQSATLPDAKAAVDEVKTLTAAATTNGAPADPELVAAVTARDAFLGSIVHEMRNAVAPIVLVADQLHAMGKDAGAPPALGSRAQLLTRSLNRLTTMTDRVSEVSNLWRGRLVLDIATVDLVEIAGEVCRELEGDAVAADAVLVFAPTPPVIGAWDRQRLKWIAANLLSNAIRYAGGRIEVSVEDLGTMAQLSVRDAGPGIAPAALSQLFEPFGPRAASGTPAGGFGVGLWVTRQLCSAMQGSVTVETPSSGGACFSVQLPRGT